MENTSWNLEEAVTHLENGNPAFLGWVEKKPDQNIVSSVPAKQRHTNITDLAKGIVSHAYDTGIAATTLGRLINVITRSKHCDQSTLTALIKNLYPAEKVPSSVVTKVVCCLGPSKNKPSPATQALLVRWLILVYDNLEDPSHLSKLYAVLFDHLDMVSLRRSLCHLLSMITRRKHVKPFRIQAVMELLRNVGDDERELLGLLRVFKSYYPDVIVGEAYVSLRRPTYFFKHPDPEWVVRLKIIREREATSADQNLQTFQVVRKGGVKRSRVEVVIPEVQTYRISRALSSLEEIRNLSDFVQKLDRIELPSQVVAALLDPLAQKYLLLVQNENASKRLESWLDSFFEDELDQLHASDEGEDPGNLAYVLQALVGFIRFTKVRPLSFC
jgi:centromere protein I